MTENRFCRKCLLDKVFSEQEYRSMQQYIDGIDKEIKTDEDEYKKRLDICKECDSLINGTCRECGCFVEMRAAVKNNYCPSVEKRW